jgi:hypothetical protein
VVNTFAWYSGGLEFKPWPGDWLVWLRFLCDLPQTLQENIQIVCSIRPWPLPHPLKFFIH